MGVGSGRAGRVSFAATVDGGVERFGHGYAGDPGQRHQSLRGRQANVETKHGFGDQKR